MEKEELVDDSDLQRRSLDENMQKFRTLLMEENLEIVAKLKRYKKTDFRRKLILDKLKELKRLSDLSKVWVSVPFIEQKFDYSVITVDSSKAGSNIDALRLAINVLGWKEYPKGRNQKSCHVVWNSCSFYDNRNNAGSFINKFPGIAQCLHKIGFTRILETMRVLFPDQYSFYPLTWYLPHQLSEFTLYCKSKETEKKQKSYYIVKPDAGTQGEGIYLIQDPQEYKICSKNHVVQEYLANPLLIDGYKFDLRIYGVIVSLNPVRVYLSNEGLARFCTEHYIQPNSKNYDIAFMHLTNYSLNKKSKRFVHSQNTDSGSKRTVSSVLAVLESQGYDVSKIWHNIEELVYKTVLAMVPQLKVNYVTEVMVKSDMNLSKSENVDVLERPTCFQILGFDILLMDDMQPMLLEVNSNPSLRLDCEIEIAPGICEYYISKVDINVKKPLIIDTLRILEQEILEKFDLPVIERDLSDDWMERGKETVQCADIEAMAEQNVKDRSAEQNTEQNPENVLEQTVLDVIDEDSADELSDKENIHDIRRRWSAESQFGPHFVELAKRNNTLPKNYETHNIDKENTMVEDQAVINHHPEVQVTITGTSPHIRKLQEQKEISRLSKEKSWLKSADGTAEDKNKTAPSIASGKVEMRKRMSCLTLISTSAYQSLFEKLRILEETTVIFFNAMGHRYSENMGATAFRTFGRHCKLNLLGFNHAMIDLIYVEVQRRWSYLNNLETTSGLCYQAFLEAFFRIAFAKYSDVPKRVAVQNLVDHCKKAMGKENFDWAKTLNPNQNETVTSSENNFKSNKHDSIQRQNKLQSQPQRHDMSSSASEKSFTSSASSQTKRKSDVSIKSKYELMKEIHKVYQRKLNPPIKVSNTKGDDGSPNHLPEINRNSQQNITGDKTNKFFVKEFPGNPMINTTTSFSKVYNYRSPDNSNVSAQDKLWNFPREDDNVKRQVKIRLSKTPSSAKHIESDDLYGQQLKSIYDGSPPHSHQEPRKISSHVERRHRRLSPANQEKLKQLIAAYSTSIPMNKSRKSLRQINKNVPDNYWASIYK